MSLQEDFGLTKQTGDIGELAACRLFLVEFCIFRKFQGAGAVF